MKKNWYAVYTKPNCELKVIAQFNRKKIENYFPLNYISSNTGYRKKWNTVPLFESFIFVYITEEDIKVVKETNDVVNFLYWLNNPAIISNEEVKNIERFTSDYTHIQVERSVVNPYAALQITSHQHKEINNSNVSGKYTFVKMLLPSLGYSIVASLETATVKVFDSPNNSRRELVS